MLSGALAELLEVRPEVTSIAQLRKIPPYGYRNPQSLQNKTLYVGLRRAGFPDE